ncbi:CBS domain-containing protein [Rhodobium gokarnense]|uniref:CBS domain-containing protein n=1 Tax=Rhodobium gokarnense TaxID=364296 RepID=A0ABT3HDH1_9HYPH|nr:CBS domain-containing protein [Rhodobium gokarnense]MCW2308454.1 CBS domain-containing protein [Rhodobium gokarnense]
MTVAAILSDKGREVITASPEATLSEVCETLAARKIGAIVLTGEGGSIAGIVSERDVVRAVANGGAGALETAAADHMTRSVVTCSPQETINEVMERMTQGRFRHLPVMEGGALVGVISIGDVVKIRIAMAEQEAAEMRSYITTV